MADVCFWAQSGHADRAQECPLLGVKRTSRRPASMLLLTHFRHDLIRRLRQRALAPAGREYYRLQGHPTWIGTEFLTQSLRQGGNDSIRIDAAAHFDLIN